ncbi:MAG: phosphatase PAP2 family protein [Rhodoferax sp.]
MSADLSTAPASRAPVAAPWVWALPLVLLLVGAPLWLHWWEPQMFLAINQGSAVLSPFVWTALSLLGNAWGVLGVTAPLLVWAPRYVWAWLCAAPFAIVFARAGKAFIEHPRPAAVVDNALMRIVGEPLHNVSMPSGHTLTAFAVAAGLYFALPRARRWRYAWLWLLAAATGWSRMAVGAHWPGDVAVGAALGLLSGLLGQHLLARVPAPWLRPRSWAAGAVAALMLAAAYNLSVEALDFAENQGVQWALAALIGASLLLWARQAWRDGSAGSQG